LTFNRKNIIIQFHHVPSHQGTYYNEIADLLANSTVDTPISINTRSLTLLDIARHRKTIKWFLPPILIFPFRETNVLYFRIKSNYLILKKEEQEWNKRDEPHWRFCLKVPETLQHIIFECYSTAYLAANIKRTFERLKTNKDIDELFKANYNASDERYLYKSIIDFLVDTNIV
jgi:hypothetical protein